MPLSRTNLCYIARLQRTEKVSRASHAKARGNRRRRRMCNVWRLRNIRFTEAVDCKKKGNRGDRDYIVVALKRRGENEGGAMAYLLNWRFYAEWPGFDSMTIGRSVHVYANEGVCMQRSWRIIRHMRFCIVRSQFLSFAKNWRWLLLMNDRGQIFQKQKTTTEM